MSKVNFFIVVLLLVAIAVMGYLIFIVRTEGLSCLDNPLGYGVRGIEKANEATAQCTCTIAKPNTPKLVVTADKAWLDYSALVSPSRETTEEINLSKIFINKRE